MPNPGPEVGSVPDKSKDDTEKDQKEVGKFKISPRSWKFIIVGVTSAAAVLGPFMYLVDKIGDANKAISDTNKAIYDLRLDLQKQGYGTTEANDKLSKTQNELNRWTREQFSDLCHFLGGKVNPNELTCVVTVSHADGSVSEKEIRFRSLVF